MDKLYIVSDSRTSQYQNKNGFLDETMGNKRCHGKGPMDGFGACIKQTIKDTITYNPNGIISNTEELMQYMPDLSNICISTYNENDIISYREFFPDMDDLKILESGGFGIPKVHEIFILKEDNGILYWKKGFPDSYYGEAQIIE